MAYRIHSDAEEVYVITEEFKKCCLKEDGSLFFKSKEIWTEENLSHFIDVFLGHPDLSSDDFFTKFERQLRGKRKSTIVLAAELLSVYLLFPELKTINGRFSKEQAVEEVLNWAGLSLPQEHLIRTAFKGGLGDAGQANNRYRPFQIAFLASYVRRLKSHPEKNKLLAEATRFGRDVHAVNANDALGEHVSKYAKYRFSIVPMQNILTHLIFPAYFERIASRRHKEMICKAFSEYTNDQDSIDDKLWDIRASLIPSGFNDFYEPYWKAKWHGLSSSELRKRKKAAANSPTRHPVKYWVFGLREYEPHHSVLQGQYVKHLSENELEYIEDDKLVDVRYRDGGDWVFVEVKPTVNIATRYAIRVAVGQLLEYQYAQNPAAKLEIVLGDKPQKDEIDFVESLGMRLLYLDSDGQTFQRLL